MVSENSDENKDLRPAEQLLAAWLEAQAKKNAQKVKQDLALNR